MKTNSILLVGEDVLYTMDLIESYSTAYTKIRDGPHLMFFVANETVFAVKVIYLKKRDVKAINLVDAYFYFFRAFNILFKWV